MQKHVNLVDLVKSFPTNIFLQNLASIQKRTSPMKFAHLAEESENGSVSNLSTEAALAGDWGSLRHGEAAPGHRHEGEEGRSWRGVPSLVERFDIEPFSDFSAK